MRSMRACLAAAIFLASAAPVAMADGLAVLCAGAMKAPVSALLASRDPGLPPVVASYATAGAMRERIERGERPDIVIAPADDVSAMTTKGLVDAESRRALGQTEVGVAVRAGAPVPDISTADALRAALLAARKVVIVDPAKGTSGRLVEALFKELRIDDAMQGKTIKVDGGYVVEAVARGEADLGLHQISEILPVAGVTLVGPLPEGLRRVTRYDLAVMTGTAHRDEAEALARALHSHEARGVFEKSGFVRTR